MTPEQLQERYSAEAYGKFLKEHKPEVYKMTIERISDGQSFVFYTNGYEQLLEAEFYANKISDAKTLEQYCFADKIREKFQIKK